MEFVFITPTMGAKHAPTNSELKMMTLVNPLPILTTTCGEALAHIHRGGGHWQKFRKPRVRKYKVDFIQDT